MRLARRRPLRFGWRTSRFYPLTGDSNGPFRTLGLTLRFLRLAAGRREQEMATALETNAGGIEAIERGCVGLWPTDADRWVEVCGAGDGDVLLAGLAAEALWPRELPVLELPQFWGAGAPSIAEFRTARHLIERMRQGGGFAAEAGAARVAHPERWLADFFGPLEACEASEEYRESRTATIGTGEQDQPPSSWRTDPVGRFNGLLAAQGPLGVFYLAIEEPVQ